MQHIRIDNKARTKIAHFKQILIKK